VRLLLRHITLLAAAAAAAAVSLVASQIVSVFHSAGITQQQSMLTMRVFVCLLYCSLNILVRFLVTVAAAWRGVMF